MGMYDVLADSLQRIYANEGANQANLAIAKGNALARGQEQSGQIWGQTLGQLGGMVANLPGQIAQQKEAALRGEVTSMQLQGLKDAKAGETAANQLIASLPKTPDGMFDTASLQQQLAAKGVPLHVAEPLLTSAEKMNEIHRKVATDKLDRYADVADVVLSAHKPGEPVTPDALDMGFELAKHIGLAQDADKGAFMQSIQQTGLDPEGALKGIRRLSKKYADQEKPTFAPRESPGYMQGGTFHPIDVPEKNPTESSLALKAAGGDPTKALGLLQAPALQNANRAEAAQVESARHNRAMEVHAKAEEALSRARLNQEGSAAKEDAESVADAIISGDQPATVQGLYRLAGPVRAALARKGFNLTTANLDWEATKKHLSTLNGAQQTRLRQAIGTAGESLGVIEDLAKQWDGGRFPLLNKANLALAKNGAMGSKAQQIATNLVAQITDVTSELGNVYMGGNSPTDHALSLASQNLSADWTKDQLLSAIKLARTNLQIRNNSITNSGAITATSQAAPAAQTPAATAVGTIKTFPNGKKGRWDGTGWEQVK